MSSWELLVPCFCCSSHAWERTRNVLVQSGAALLCNFPEGAKYKVRRASSAILAQAAEREQQAARLPTQALDLAVLLPAAPACHACQLSSGVHLGLVIRNMHASRIASVTPKHVDFQFVILSRYKSKSQIATKQIVTSKILRI